MDGRYNPCGPGWTRRFIVYHNVTCQRCNKRLEVVEKLGWYVTCPECDARYMLKIEPFCTQPGRDIQPRLTEFDGETFQLEDKPEKSDKPVFTEDDGA